jgi:hypothetical protein
MDFNPSVSVAATMISYTNANASLYVRWAAQRLKPPVSPPTSPRESSYFQVPPFTDNIGMLPSLPLYTFALLIRSSGRYVLSERPVHAHTERRRAMAESKWNTATSLTQTRSTGA